ncbi:MAG: hypothetical protein Q4G16_05275 [Cruoricaptor ignavus]|nr:hypothetical protein [Cruoricaptor ignavus]
MKIKVRKKRRILEIILSLLIALYAFIKIKTSDEAHKLAIDIFISIILVLGLVVKMTLSFILPLIEIDPSGIKFIGLKKIHWKEIKILEESVNNIKIIIEKSNNKRIVESLKNLDIDSKRLNKILNLYLKKYGFSGLSKINLN